MVSRLLPILYALGSYCLNSGSQSKFEVNYNMMVNDEKFITKVFCGYWVLYLLGTIFENHPHFNKKAVN